MTTTVTGRDAEDGTTLDPYDVGLALHATGLLREFNQAGVLSAADVHVARTVGRLGEESDERVLLAVALAVRAIRLGSVCVALGGIREGVAPDTDSRTGVAQGLRWPEPEEWLRACARSHLVAVGEVADDVADQGRPVRLVDDLLYLDRYWRQEQVVRAELDSRAAQDAPVVDVDALRDALARLFPGEPPDLQRLAAAMTALRPVTVLAGGPGTGKTTTVARLLALLRSLPGEQPRVALAAPTGKAAARLQEAVIEEAATAGLDLGEVSASTLHRLLGSRPDSRSRFRHDRHNRLPFDVVVVDESSMVSLTLMSRLMEAVRLDARLVLVGDPDQLASVEAGAVLGDLVARPAAPGLEAPASLHDLVGSDLGSGELVTNELRNGVVRLTKTYRFGSTIGSLARAIQDDDGDRVVHLLRSEHAHLSFVEMPEGVALATEGLDTLRDDVVSAARDLTNAAVVGDSQGALAALGGHRLLCAHRRGRYGVGRWTAEIEGWLTAGLDNNADVGEWYLGRPLLITANDYELQVFNGDTGVVIKGEDDGDKIAAIGRGRAPLLISTNRLSAVQTVHTMTVHRAQGSQFDQVSIILPPAESPLLTRELFYTAVTRAKDRVRVIGSEAAVRRAVSTPIVRASGLRRVATVRPR